MENIMNSRNFKRTSVITAALAAILLAPVATHAKFTKTPYVQNVKTEGITICWEADRIFETKLTVSPAAGGKPVVITANPDSFGEVNVSGLTPGASYKYEVSQSGGEKGGGTFTTAPSYVVPFRFIAMGDTRNGHDKHKNILSGAKKFNPAFALNSGDLVGAGTDPKEWDKYFDVAGDFMKDVPVYPTLGNHEMDSPHYYKYFSLPQNGDKEHYYSFAYSNALFIVLDTNAPYNTSSAQKKFLIDQLSASREFDFRVVMFHHPMYSSSKRPPNLNIRKMFSPIFKKYKVDIVFNGHDHFYERSIDENGVQYVIAGGGGAPLYNFEKDNPESKVKKMAYHFLVVEVSGSVMKAKAIDIDGGIFDEFEIPSKTAKR